MDASDQRLLTEDKQALRRKMGAEREALPPAARRAGSQAACERLAALPEVQALLEDAAGPKALVVAGYVAAPAKSELDPEGFLASLRKQGGRVVLPRVARTATPRLRFHEVTPEELRFGTYGLLEPDERAPEVAVTDIGLMVVPGLAFDAEGRRLGWGGGYYDEVARYLASRGKHVRLVGVAYDFQIVDRCPSGPADMAVDLVVTDRRVLRRSPEVT